jgi:hypothetical protein
MKKTLLLAVALAVVGTSAFGATATLNCTPVNGVNTSIVVSSLFFTQGSGSGSFTCSDASLGAITLSSVSISILTDFTKGNGTATDPTDNSAGFTFSNALNWDFAHPGAFTSTMKLETAPGVTLFTIGNLSSSANTFTNTTSGGLTGTQYILPTTEALIGTTGGDTFSINVNAFVDAGGFTSGASDASIQVTYSYSAVTTGTPEPVSMLLFGSGLLAVSLMGRKKFSKR